MSEILDGLNIYQQPTRTAAEAGKSDEVYVVVYDTTGTHRKTYKMLGSELATKLGSPAGKAYTFASVPSASANKYLRIHISDRSHKPAYSDGTNWRWFSTDAVIS